MRIKQITDKFVSLRDCSGAYTKSKWDFATKTQVLYHRYGENKIAEIYDYTDSKNFRLRLHPRNRGSGRNAHSNRLGAVLESIQMMEERDWKSMRYQSFIRYSQKVYDRNLSAEYELTDGKPLEFIYKDGRLVMDYKHFESRAYPDEPVGTAVIEIDSNSNLQTQVERLTNILQGV